MTPWKLVYNKFDPEKENLREALCTLGNGYFGTRGAFPGANASKVHYPGTYIAGVYNTLGTEIANRTIYNEDFVNCPNWLMLNYRIEDGPWFNRQTVKILSFKQELNMRKGILSRRIKWKDDQGRITLVENHFIVSMAHPHCGAMRLTITPQNYDGEVTVRSGIDGNIINAGVDRYKQLKSNHLEPCSHGKFGRDGIFLQMQTTQSLIQITQAMRTLIYDGATPIRPALKVISHGRQRIMHECRLTVKQNQRISLEKLVSVYTSRDHGVSDNCTIAQEKVTQIDSFESLFKAHQAKWLALWKKFDIQVEGDDFVQLALRLHTFHLLQSASTYNEDIDAGMPVRGLHGEAYRGHIFWDELYAYPFYNLRAPEITRALLMYRYRRLNAAKDYARQHGYKGAMYPWQSASTGEEVTQIIHLNPMSNQWGPDYSSLQRHVSIAIAYNVWNYYFTTGDRDFLDRYGAEMIVEIAHFWGSIAKFNITTHRFEIKGVMGPDEFHEKYPGASEGGIKNNAYTNVMAVWVIEKALKILDDMMEEEDRTALLLKADVSETDISRWRDIIRKMMVPIDKHGIIHQFDGYMELKELDWDDYRARYDNIHRIDRILKSEGLFPDSFKVAKQADTLMLFFVLSISEVKEIFQRLGYKLTKEMVQKNFDYYFKRCSHGSTLSMVVHAHVAGLLGNQDLSMSAFLDALKSDIYDTQGGTTQEGIHSGVMGSSIDLFLSSFAGLRLAEDRLSLEPNLPEHWKRIKFSLRFKNMWFQIVVTHKELTVTAKPLRGVALRQVSKIPIEIDGRSYELSPAKPYTVKLGSHLVI